jgi:menaquinone-dependent protoporphyrinogen IX oxidase
MQKTLILYESKYSSTAEAAKIIALVMGSAKCSKIHEFQEKCKDFPFIIIGFPVYSGKLDEKVMDFVKENRDWLAQRKVCLFSTSISHADGIRNLKKLKEVIGDSVIHVKALGGRLELDKLDEEDRLSIEDFCESFNLPLQSMDSFKKEAVIKYSLKLKNLKDTFMDKMDDQELKKQVEEFLKSHNTCTLSTGYQNRVRATPIEYTYHDGSLYLLSEGGEKFANLLLNPKVSVAVYEPYSGMDNLAGMQISGSASLVDRGDEEYKKIIQLKGLKMDFIESLPINMSMIKISMGKIEFLYSKFKDEGYSTRQIYWFKDSSE